MFWICGIIIATIFIALIELYIFISGAEYIWCVMHNQIPFVPSSVYLRRALINEIDKHFPNATSICDIGAGYGGLAQYIARHRNMTVIALENMPFTITIAHVMKFINQSPIKIIKCDVLNI